MPSSRLRVALAGVLVTLVSLSPGRSSLSAQTDLDSFMKDVVARRDDNWKKLQQYILDEREETKITGPGGTRLWGEERDYTWFIREGYFIRSPVKVDGAVISEGERRKAEDDYLRRMKRFDERAAARGRQGAPADGPILGDENGETPTSVDSLIRQSRQPRFVSSSYFLRFKFDEGRYALAGREKFEGRDVLRVEYYPTKLYGGDDQRGRRGRGREPTPKERQQQADIQRLMNKVALITMWIEPSTHQIVKFTFDNVDFDFLPLPWLVKVDSFRASMTMSQAFPNVWLPKDMDINAALTLAIGQFAFRQAVAYRDYREANVASRVIIPGAR
jgi:hypothetical protein